MICTTIAVTGLFFVLFFVFAHIIYKDTKMWILVILWHRFDTCRIAVLFRFDGYNFSLFPVLCISIFWVLMFEEITPRISYWGSWKLCFVYMLETWWLSDEIDFALVIYLWIHRMLPNGLVLKTSVLQLVLFCTSVL
jgi:hypothetical protein